MVSCHGARSADLAGQRGRQCGCSCCSLSPVAGSQVRRGERTRSRGRASRVPAMRGRRRGRRGRTGRGRRAPRTGLSRPARPRCRPGCVVRLVVLRPERGQPEALISYESVRYRKVRWNKQLTAHPVMLTPQTAAIASGRRDPRPAARRFSWEGPHPRRMAGPGAHLRRPRPAPVGRAGRPADGHWHRHRAGAASPSTTGRLRSPQREPTAPDPAIPPVTTCSNSVNSLTHVNRRSAWRWGIIAARR